MKSIIDEILEIFYDTMINGNADEIELEKRMKPLIDTLLNEEVNTVKLLFDILESFITYVKVKKKLPHISYFEKRLSLVEIKLKNGNLTDNEYLAYIDFQKYLRERISLFQNKKKLNLDSIPKNHVCYAIIELSNKYNIPDLELIQTVESNSKIGALLGSYQVEKNKLYSKDHTIKIQSMKYKIENQKKIRNKYYATKELIENYLIDIYKVKQT